MAQIVVSTDVLINQASVVEGLITRVSNNFEQMKKSMENTRSYWIGEAAEAHRSKYDSQLPSIDEIIKRLRENVKDLRIMAGVYDTAERLATAETEALIETVID